MCTLIIHQLSEIDRIAEVFLDRTKDRKIVAFYAPMGSGKTTFITALCRALGISQIVNSPTFAIANQYTTPSNEVVYHIDCYRLEKIEDALNVGIATYLEEGARCFIEWPEVIEELLPEDTCRVTIEVLSNGERKLTIE